MTSKLLKVFLLLAILAVVVFADDSSTNSTSDQTNVIDQCIKRENCAADDQACRSACSGSPDPSPKVANDTQVCYTNCYNDYLPKDEKGYSDCTQKCKTDVYQQGITEPGSSVPSKSSTNGGSGGSNSGDNGQDNGGNSSDSNGSSDSNSTDDKNSTGAASLTTGSAVYVYAFAAIFACVVFGFEL